MLKNAQDTCDPSTDLLQAFRSAAVEAISTEAILDLRLNWVWVKMGNSFSRLWEHCDELWDLWGFRGVSLIFWQVNLSMASSWKKCSSWQASMQIEQQRPLSKGVNSFSNDVIDIMHFRIGYRLTWKYTMELCTCNCESMQEECVLYLRCGSDFSLSALPLSWSHLLCGP